MYEYSDRYRPNDEGGDMATAGRPEASELDPQLKRELEDLTAGMCRALNDPKRLIILYALAESPRSVGALGALLDASQSNVSQHLAVLRDRGLVDSERDGARAVYSLRHPRVVEAIDILREVTSDELDRRRALRIGA
jgi:DNA-binding transcriptional ArsR family regulator